MPYTNLDAFALQSRLLPISYFTPFLVFFSLIAIGAIIGASTNIVNGCVGPHYFRIIMRWKFNSIWAAAIGQGILEGAVYGFFFGLIYMLAFSIITRFRGTFEFAKSIFQKTIPLIYFCWFIAGTIVIIWSLFFWESYERFFPITPENLLDRVLLFGLADQFGVLRLELLLRFPIASS